MTKIDDLRYMHNQAKSLSNSDAHPWFVKHIDALFAHIDAQQERLNNFDAAMARVEAENARLTAELATVTAERDALNKFAYADIPGDAGYGFCNVCDASTTHTYGWICNRCGREVDHIDTPQPPAAAPSAAPASVASDSDKPNISEAALNLIAQAARNRNGVQMTPENADLIDGLVRRGLLKDDSANGRWYVETDRGRALLAFKPAPPAPASAAAKPVKLTAKQRKDKEIARNIAQAILRNGGWLEDWKLDSLGKQIIERYPQWFVEQQYGWDTGYALTAEGRALEGSK